MSLKLICLAFIWIFDEPGVPGARTPGRTAPVMLHLVQKVLIDMEKKTVYKRDRGILECYNCCNRLQQVRGSSKKGFPGRVAQERSYQHGSAAIIVLVS